MSPRAGNAEDFAGALAARVARYGDRPLVTWYGAVPGERVELSWRTFGNWVAKTANLLVDELGVEPGDRVATVLPVHWQAPVVLVACWLVGATVVPAGPGVPREAATAVLAGAGCRVAFVHEELLAEARERLGGDRSAAAGRPTLV
ncbi:MAG TPA: TIGR03089 family protein, partial [Actinomycetes bacterium]|nr:TIGR03089 family protein [Actinomycetes bacterium]